MVYVGVDLHRKRSQVAVVNEAGEVLANLLPPPPTIVGDRPRPSRVASGHPSRTLTRP